MNWVDNHPMIITAKGSETVHRQDSSPTRNLETVHRQNWRQFTDTFEDSSLTKKKKKKKKMSV